MQKLSSSVRDRGISSNKQGIRSRSIPKDRYNKIPVAVDKPGGNRSLYSLLGLNFCY